MVQSMISFNTNICYPVRDYDKQAPTCSGTCKHSGADLQESERSRSGSSWRGSPLSSAEPMCPRWLPGSGPEPSKERAGWQSSMRLLLGGIWA